MITRNDLSLGAVRLLALYLIVRAVRRLPALIFGWSSLSTLSHVGLFAAAVLVAVVPLLIAIGMALFSRRIARWVMPSSDEPLDPMPGVSLVQSVAIGTFGLFLVAADLPSVVLSVSMLEMHNELANQSKSLFLYPAFLGSVLSVGIGVVLLTGAAFWSRLISRFRRLGAAGSEQ